jgi:hypothetical protein
MTLKKITPEVLDKAHEYAIQKLCDYIPKVLTHRSNDTNYINGKCTITRQGCNANDSRNPFSRKLYDESGNFIDFKKTSGGNYQEIWKKNPPQFLVMKRIKTKSGKPGDIVCSRGNFLLQNWCENPKSRSANGKSVPGVTNVPSFKYFVNTNGEESCEIPKSYCDKKGQSYDSSTKKCYVPGGQSALEFVTGTTIVRMARVSDKRLKENIKMFHKDFIDKGIHLYTFTWSSIANNLYNNVGDDLGFIADDLEEINNKYVYKDMYGYKNIDFDYLKDTKHEKIVNFLKIKQQIWKKF